MNASDEMANAIKQKFGQFDWKCYRDEKPKDDSYIYVFDSEYPQAPICIEFYSSDNSNLGDHEYWAYVFIPDAPKSEKNKFKYSLEVYEDHVLIKGWLSSKILTTFFKLCEDEGFKYLVPSDGTCFKLVRENEHTR